MNELKAGETVKAKITKNLTYEVTNNGWTLNIKCNKPGMAVKASTDGSFDIIFTGSPEEDEV